MPFEQRKISHQVMSVPIGHFRNWCPPPQSLFVVASLLQRCEEHNVLMMKDALCRQKESITQPVDEPALSCHSRHHQPAFCHRHQKKAIGWILFVCQIWPFFSWHRSDHCNCIVLPCCLSLNQPGYILQAKLKFVEDLFVCSSWPLPNQIKLKLTTSSKLIEASDVVLNWLWFFENAKRPFNFSVHHFTTGSKCNFFPKYRRDRVIIKLRFQQSLLIKLKR